MKILGLKVNRRSFFDTMIRRVKKIEKEIDKSGFENYILIVEKGKRIYKTTNIGKRSRLIEEVDPIIDKAIDGIGERIF